MEYRVPYKHDSVKCSTTQVETIGIHLALYCSGSGITLMQKDSSSSGMLERMLRGNYYIT
jgi:hypothetical protein